MLDLGTGNGWLAHRLSELRGVQIWGVDRRSSELTQAARLFGTDQLAFMDCDIFQAPFPAGAFNLIVIASAIQYFPDLPELVRVLLKQLRAGGELHIMDSPLYQEDEVAAARERTRVYYERLGLPEMTGYYFHHTFSEMESFSPRWLYRPAAQQGRLSRLLSRTDSPFPWLCICK